MSVDHQNDCIVLVWKNTKLDKMLTLDAVGFEKDDFLSIAQILDFILSRQ